MVVSVKLFFFHSPAGQHDRGLRGPDVPDADLFPAGERQGQLRLLPGQGGEGAHEAGQVAQDQPVDVGAQPPGRDGLAHRGQVRRTRTGHGMMSRQRQRANGGGGGAAPTSTPPPPPPPPFRASTSSTSRGGLSSSSSSSSCATRPSSRRLSRRQQRQRRGLRRGGGGGEDPEGGEAPSPFPEAGGRGEGRGEGL